MLLLACTRAQLHDYVCLLRSLQCCLFARVCVCSQQLLPVVLVGTSQHAVSPVRVMLDLLEEVWRAEDAHETGWRAAWTQPQRIGIIWHTDMFIYTHSGFTGQLIYLFCKSQTTASLFAWGLKGTVHPLEENLCFITLMYLRLPVTPDWFSIFGADTNIRK